MSALLAALFFAETSTDLRDKTLVVWASPSLLTQSGGSALTIDDGRDHFDGIVFGEISHSKWMAGSDVYRRTVNDQSTVPDETTDPHTMVQIAITYAGREVCLYRNGVLLEHHQFDGEPQAYGPASRINIGIRHRRASDAAHFAGSIDDARIYDRALSKDQINQLRPNQLSAIKPWAWWNFEDKSGKDLTGRFKFTKLSPFSQIKDGKLILDGISNTFEALTGQVVPYSFETPTRPKVIPTNWLTFHLVHPGPNPAMPGDPNCAFFWKGRYHLHYIYHTDEGFAFAHVSSFDMLHWKWHPTTLVPFKVGHGMFSGTGFYTKEGRPAIIYHGQGSGRNQVAVALDDKLEKWSTPTPIIPIIKAGQDASKIANWDPDAWIDHGSYYALSGGTPGSGKPPTLFKSADLKSWDYLGPFMTHDMSDVRDDEDVSCPNFFPIGSKHMLLCISHNLGCRYYLGDWKNEQFTPDFHARMNWHGIDYFAPESVLTPDGRRVMWAWCAIQGFATDHFTQTGIQSLPRELSLPSDGILRIKPLRELERLRTNEQKVTMVSVQPGNQALLNGICSDATELRLEFKPSQAREYGMKVYCDPTGKRGFPITVIPSANVLRLGAMKVPFQQNPGEPVTLRIFLDKRMIEVFANDRQAAVATYSYQPKEFGVQLISEGRTSVVSAVTSWQMKSIY